MIYQISSGQGPSECELGVAKFLAYLQENYSITILDTSAGYHQGTFRSVRFCTEADLSEYVGSIQWICRSSYRPHHRRKNWFIDLSECTASEMKEFDTEQVVFETFRSGGNGGQNVNKVETGVRAIYLPTGSAVVCTEERSQYANKRKAVLRLRENLRGENQRHKADEKKRAWKAHTQLKRGNASVRFIGSLFTKDDACED